MIIQFDCSFDGDGINRYMLTYRQGARLSTLHTTCLSFQQLVNLNQVLATFSVKHQVVNILDFVGYMVSVATSHLCHCGAKAVIGHVTNEWA